MEPQFAQHLLFRAFQSTKKNGLGIGLFQSRAIIEAHGRRIEVESEPGTGIVFRVYLPLAASPPPLERRSAVESEVSPKPSFDLTRDSRLALCAFSRRFAANLGEPAIAGRNGKKSQKLLIFGQSAPLCATIS